MVRLTISQVAAQSNVHLETVRYYERRGLIAKPYRNASGYRMFTQETVEDIQFIKRAQEIGFSLEEIRGLLTIYRQEDYFPTYELYQTALSKIQEIDEQIKRLSHFKATLEAVTQRPSSMHASSKLQCPILLKCSNKEEDIDGKDRGLY
ncbi:MerR family transcriptional regulator [Paenibacillus agilis]|uniref:MerR family transcriptional regulator n=1 Tax=Paenibacillus agilis TaxID=3020863 RepID=A0A559J1R3_9BACL|nr:MerR family transcriptional regulator [Paenibacillus agilis]TVX93825.1 MerR family transcriptional regulator [Paenibacillus agilis]